jgi:SAM-dependent methyltransferase
MPLIPSAPDGLQSHEKHHGPGRILEFAFAFRQARALMSAVEFDLFTVLSEGPLECGALARRVNINLRGARDFFDVLAAHELIHRDQRGRYRNAADCDRYLNRRSPDYLGDLVEHLNTRMYEIWGRLTRSLRSGAPQSGALGDSGYKALYADPATFAKFLRAMTAGSRVPAIALAREFNWKEYASFMDIGTAQGCVPVELAMAHPHLVGGGFDLPEVQVAFHDYVNTLGLGSRLSFHAGNFFEDEFPGADVLIMGRILHNWGLPTKKMLLQKAHRALPPGGVLIVYDPMLDDDRRNIAALFASLTMLLETQDGFECTLGDCRDWMVEVGFHGIQPVKLDAGHTAMIGCKRG